MSTIDPLDHDALFQRADQPPSAPAITPALATLTARVERLEQRVDAFDRDSPAQPATPTDEERAAWVAHVMTLAGELVDDANDFDAFCAARDRLRDAVTALARGEDPRGAR